MRFKGDPDKTNMYVMDTESTTEMTLLMLQDCLVTRGMGGLFNFSFGAPFYESQYQNLMIAFKTGPRTAAQLSLTTTEEEIEQAYNWLLTEMRQSTFRGLWYLLTVWGQKPE